MTRDQLLEAARENYGWCGVALTALTLFFKSTRDLWLRLWQFLYKPISTLEKLIASVDGLTVELSAVNQRLVSVDSRLLGLETVIQSVVRVADAAHLKARMAFEESATGYFEADMNGDCVWVNPALAKLFALPRETMTGRGWLAALHPDDINRINAQWEDTVIHRRPYIARYRLQRERETLTVEASASVLNGADSSPLCIWGRVIPLPTIAASALAA